jgi:Zn-dependent peptidase ImmA (M78 family)/transcriptional regulator with XRE-family HTH domain
VSFYGDAGVASPDTLALARVARGLTQAELASVTGISQAYLSKAEKGAVELEGDRLEAVADALGYPKSLFLLTSDVGPSTTACVFPRKRNSLPVSAERRIRALLDITRLQVEALVGDEAPPVRLPREAPTDDGWIGPEEIAARVRSALDIAPGPIGNLTSGLERLGAMIVTRDLGNRRLDAIGQWPEGRRPLFLVNATASADRRRFTLAHELGHAVMHTEPRADQEEQADRFASALLMPASDIQRDLGELDVPRLVRLKSEWRVSMAALIRRARDLGAISDYRYKQLNIAMSASGYRTREPAAFEPEHPTFVASTVSRLIHAGQDTAKLADRAHMTEAELQGLYLEGQLT